MLELRFQAGCARPQATDNLDNSKSMKKVHQSQSGSYSSPIKWGIGICRIRMRYVYALEVRFDGLFMLQRMRFEKFETFCSEFDPWVSS